MMKDIGKWLLSLVISLVAGLTVMAIGHYFKVEEFKIGLWTGMTGTAVSILMHSIMFDPKDSKKDRQDESDVID